MKNLYVNENLTKTRKQLLWKTKQTAKERNCRYVWTMNGKILTRKNDMHPVIEITDLKDIDKL